MRPNFHRREICLKRFMIVLSFIVCPFFFIGRILSLFFLSTALKRTVIIFRFSLLIFLTAVFIKLYYGMKNYHRFEWSRNRKTMLLSIAFIHIYYAMRFIQIYTDNLTFFTLFFKNRQIYPQNLILDAIEGVFSYLLYVVQIGILMPCLVVFIKPTQDILQGLSKLDHLCKVSIFQVVKQNPELKQRTRSTHMMVFDQSTQSLVEYSIERMNKI